MTEEKLSRADKRRARKKAGEDGGRIARLLMEIKESELKRMTLDEDLLYEVVEARKIKSNSARRREERRLAGVLRAYDLDEIDEQLAELQNSKQADARLFKLAESWRDRLSNDPRLYRDFIAAYPEHDCDDLEDEVDHAHQEATTGKPKGAKKKLFRSIMSIIR